MKINIEKRFSFAYGGVDCRETEYTVSVSSAENGEIREYIFPKGLKVTNILKRYESYDACEWENIFENISDEPTEIISGVFDADITWDTLPDRKLRSGTWKHRPEDRVVKINAPLGSCCSGEDFFCDPDYVAKNHEFPNYLQYGVKKEYRPKRGRSADTQAPYFEIFQEDCGFIAAVGWSGQWNAFVERDGDSVRFRSGIEGTGFYLTPGEKVRTSSVVLMEYSDGTVNAHNKWRRLLKNEFSVMRRYGANAEPPLCAQLWGSMDTKTAIARVDAMEKWNFPVECYWMDAGWYGYDASVASDEEGGDWWKYTGDWRVNKNCHPDGLVSLAERVKETGKGFLLWFDSERAVKGTVPTVEHPEYYLRSETDEQCVLINLGDEKARRYIFDVIAGYIERLHLSVFRQDNCFADMTNFWRENDQEGRAGITQIKYINGFYAFWDGLLEKFPGLLIDNCASGGRRVDIEALKRSVPLWRSDTTCSANYRQELVQNNSLGYNSWMPYSGAGSGRLWGDPYDFRSAYASGFAISQCFSQADEFGGNAEQMAWLKKYLDEFVRVRPYMSCDFYPLTEPIVSLDVWSAARFDRPEQGDGIILAFRRDKSNYSSLTFDFVNADEGCDYEFCDEDTGESFVLTSDEIKNGVTISIPDKRQSKLYFYRKLV